MIVSPAKAAEPVKMPFGVWTPVSPRKQELDGGPDLPMERCNFWREERPIVKYRYYRPRAAAMRAFVKLL